MIFAAYAGAGAGLAFLLLLTLSSLGLAVVVVGALWGFVRLRSLRWCAITAGLLQAWAVYFWARQNWSAVPRGTLEWVWLGSLGIVVVALAVSVFFAWREAPA
jgi:hypothetical protein